ncbi:hypothetical protein KR51_00014440 [Rubidibacter lacunae KORDI 51-2]|uniref:CENP-V/GFA domain-containing protein n=1 Tax=Rubidibacter lacunae KORDI 51-2 TaxID=582515 RepID=U5DJP1_9CHRO|nr:GFA family protein [Rubidibacter lacunae]ERN41911.1 hypothetical protein KR51_00014440 [Rubidibacter lacunae KORDI 51-2]
MPELFDAKGSCLCGAISFYAKNACNNVGACHCGMCRKWGGGPLMVVNCGTNVLFDGEDNISVYDSSSWAERGFCKQCGSHLFYRLKESGLHMIPAGLFKYQDLFVFSEQIFVDKKPAFYDFSNDTNNMSESECIEKYGI